MKKTKTLRVLVPLIRVKASSPGFPFDIFRLNAPFVDAFNQLNILPVGIPIGVPKEMIADCLKLVDGVLIQGGEDVHPKFFAPDEALHERVYFTSVERDEFEIALVKEARAKAVPLLGICRGAQIINIVHGGTLYQDQPSQFPTNVSHFPNPEIDFSTVTPDDLGKNAHAITIEPNTELAQVFQAKKVPCNSLHHQVIKEVGAGLVVNARAEDGVIEGVEGVNMRDHWLLGVQWHPELSGKLNANHHAIFERFATVLAQSRS